jgi:D-alanyl-D-alanine-carboxypeptidase/D-alanyl-D-alanine-endopeptidase
MVMKGRIRYLLFALGVLLLATDALVQSLPPSIPNDAEIRKILLDRIDVQHQGVGIVVGVIEPAGRRVVAYGWFDQGDKRPVNGDTLFEIGSATKVFTSLLLTDAVQRGEVALTDAVAKFLPPDLKVPERGGRKITLQYLATHTSGLPRLPSNFPMKDPANPYADYTVPMLYAFLSTYELPRDIGSMYEYSNLGAGLMEHALSRRAGANYETLMRSRIAGPLAMTSTVITLSESLKRRLAPGHNEQLRRVANWDFPVLTGAGAIRSTANDLLNFLAANLGYTKSPLAPAMAAQLAVRRPTGTPNLEIALGWHIASTPVGEIVWHNGGTGGYRSFIAFDARRRSGVVVLSNTFTNIGVDDIGMHLLNPATPLTAPAKVRKEVAVDPKLLDAYMGRYEITPTFFLTITRDGDHLSAQATGQPKFELFAESDHDFFLKAVDAQLTFQTDDKGVTTGLILHQNGANVPAKVRKGIAVDPKLLDAYVGRYEITPTFIMTITRDGDHLVSQATGQQKAELFAESDHDFFVKVADAQLTFQTDDKGVATGLILHQNGANVPAKRLGSRE